MIRSSSSIQLPAARPSSYRRFCSRLWKGEPVADHSRWRIPTTANKNQTRVDAQATPRQLRASDRMAYTVISCTRDGTHSRLRASLRHILCNACTTDSQADCFNRMTTGSDMGTSLEMQTSGRSIPPRMESDQTSGHRGLEVEVVPRQSMAVARDGSLCRHVRHVNATLAGLVVVCLILAVIVWWRLLT